MEYTDSRHSGLLDGKYWEFFIPTILMAMTSTMSIVVDSIIVGNLLGADCLAAVNLVMPVMMAYNTVAVCLGLGAATVISVAKGRRQTAYGNEIFTVAVLSMLVISGLFLFSQVLFLDDICQLLTGEPTLLPLVKSYLQVLMFGTPMVIVTLGMTYCLRVDARVKLASAILIIANLVNLALDLVYMGPLKMGIAGSALATISGYTVGAVLLLSYVFSKKRTLRINLNVCTQTFQVFRHLREILVTGSPAAMGSILITLKILSINTIVLSVAGKSGMVAFSVCISCLSLVSMFISGAAQAMTPIVGVLYGEADYMGVRFVMKRAFQVLLATSLVSILVLEFYPVQLLELFGVRHPADIMEGVHAIRIFAVSLVGTSVSFLLMFYFMTVGHKKLSNAISVVQGFAVVVPAAWLLSRLIGISGVWMAFSLAEIATILMIVFCFLSMKKKYPEKYRDILLLDYGQLSRTTALETTSTNKAKDVKQTVLEIDGFLESLDLSPETAGQIHTAIKEILTNIAKHGYPQDKKRYMDIRLKVFDKRIVAVIRDGGKDFDPEAFLRDREQTDAHGAETESGLSRVRSMVGKIDYSRAIGFNSSTLTFHLS